jgi:DNA modification methylase
VQQSIAADTLFYGDNLAIIREHIPDESVDLVYQDPPFNSNRKRTMTLWSGEDHPVGEGKRASRAGQPSVTTMVTTEKSSTLGWPLIHTM